MADGQHELSDVAANVIEFTSFTASWGGFAHYLHRFWCHNSVLYTLWCLHCCFLLSIYGLIQNPCYKKDGGNASNSANSHYNAPQDSS